MVDYRVPDQVFYEPPNWKVRVIEGVYTGQGPTGPVGNVGIDGPKGGTGPTGDTGPQPTAITRIATVCKFTSGLVYAANVTDWLKFTTLYDSLGSTGYSPTTLLLFAGVYQIQANLNLLDTSTVSVQIDMFNYDYGGTTQVTVHGNDPTAGSTTFSTLLDTVVTAPQGGYLVFKITPTAQVTTTVNGQISIIKLDAQYDLGPTGTQAGPVGTVAGPTGPAGPQGPPRSFPTYSAMHV